MRIGSEREKSQSLDISCIFYIIIFSHKVILLKKEKYFMKVSLTERVGSFHHGHVADSSTDSCQKTTRGKVILGTQLIK